MTADPVGEGGRPPLADLESRLGHRFRQPALLDRALTHASLSADSRSAGVSNERLEFLGDRVLGLAVAHLLFETFPGETEGDLARRHAALVSGTALARVAEGINLGAHLRMARSEEGSGGRRSENLLADACEAVIAALYLDGGFTVAATFVAAQWRPLADQDLSPPKDPKTALQEWAQGRGLPLPEYRETAREGPAHAPVFTVEVRVDGAAPASATGSSKRSAERAAADTLLTALQAQ